MHMFDHQELEHLKILLQHRNRDTKSTALLKHSWEALRLELGVSRALTNWNYALLGVCATACWLKTLWKYCRENSISIMDKEAQLMLQQKGNQFLKEAFIAATYSAKDLAILNQCCTYLKAVTLADISTANG